VNFAAGIKNLQGTSPRAVLGGTGSLWLVVGWPGHDHKSCSGLTTPQPATSRGFTLLELLLVLALLAMAVAVAAPSLSRFFAGRSLDSEGRRMLALTRYAQSRAVSEGVPMVMWFDPELGKYGVKAELTYDGEDKKAVEYQLASNLQMELPSTALTTAEPIPWKITADISGIYPSIRVTPDSFIAETSPEWVWIKIIREDQPDAVWLALNANGLNYALQNTQPPPRQ
jgi:prepilin-type N-terminal cleavage/methylation domain-containing protein